MKRFLVFMLAWTLALPCCAAEQAAEGPFRPGDLVEATFTVTENTLQQHTDAYWWVAFQFGFDPSVFEIQAIVGETGRGLQLMERDPGSGKLQVTDPDRREETLLRDTLRLTGIYEEHSDLVLPVSQTDFWFGASDTWSPAPIENQLGTAWDGMLPPAWGVFRIEQSGMASAETGPAAAAPAAADPAVPDGGLIPCGAVVSLCDGDLLAAGDTVTALFRVKSIALPGDYEVTLQRYQPFAYWDNEEEDPSSGIVFSPARVRIVSDGDAQTAITVSGKGIRVTADRGTVLRTARACADHASSALSLYGMSTADVSADGYLPQVLQWLTEKMAVLHRACVLGLDQLTEEEEAAAREQADLMYQDYLLFDEDQDADDRLALEDFYRCSAQELACQKLRESVLQDVTVTEEEIQADYARRAEEARQLYLADPDGYRSQFVYNDGFGPDMLYIPAGMRKIEYLMISEETEDAEALIGKVYDLAAAPNADFESLQWEYSEGWPTPCYTYENCDLYYPEFTEAAMALSQVGDVSQPVRFAGGYYILLYASEPPEGPPDLSDVRDDLDSALGQQKQEEALQNALDQWLQEADIAVAEDLAAQ